MKYTLLFLLLLVPTLNGMEQEQSNLGKRVIQTGVASCANLVFTILMLSSAAQLCPNANSQLDQALCIMSAIGGAGSCAVWTLITPCFFYDFIKWYQNRSSANAASV